MEKLINSIFNLKISYIIAGFVIILILNNIYSCSKLKGLNIENNKLKKEIVLKDSLLKEYDKRIGKLSINYTMDTLVLKNKLREKTKGVFELEEQLKKIKNTNQNVKVTINNDSLVILFKKFLSKHYYSKKR